MQNSLIDSGKIRCLISGFICAAALWACAATAQSPVTLTIPVNKTGAAIPEDFAGLSFGMRAVLPGKSDTHFFSATNTALITLFQNLGLRHLRVGGTTVESPPATAIPNESDIDNLFAFAHAAGVQKIIYSLRLLEADPARTNIATAVARAQYIWSHYRDRLDCFALGNEPNLQRVYHQDFTITNFTSYLAQWRKFASAITNALPEAKFGGPDAASGEVSWTKRFATAEKNSSIVSVITEHYYVGGAGRNVTSEEGIKTMLSPEWLAVCQKLRREMAEPVLAEHLPFRFTEANDHYTGGVAGASDTFAGALWALDFLHWWAAHDAQGIDFHNTQWVVSDVITPDADGRLRINPKGYGLKAFDLGSHGRVQPVEVSNPDKINLTAYAVRADENLCVTIINKSFGPRAHTANVTIASPGIARHAEVIFLTAPNNDVTAKIGVTLGGASISNNSPWQGKWMPLESDEAGRCSVKVPATSAAIVRFATEQK